LTKIYINVRVFFEEPPGHEGSKGSFGRMSENIILKKEEKMQCFDCDATFEIPKDVVVGEIVSCHGCGLEFEIKQVESDAITLEEMIVEGEDWGE
jgi:alpha-aminoadipate carrier protein LysW